MNPTRFSRLGLRHLLLLGMSSALLVSISDMVQAQIAPLRVKRPEPVIGIVTDPEGKPVADAEVFLGTFMMGRRGFNHYVIGRTRSDPRGAFEVTVDDELVKESAISRPIGRWVVAYRPGSRPGGAGVEFAKLPSENERCRIVLNPSVDAPFRILGPDGAPVVGARITINRLRNPTISDQPVPMPLELKGRVAANTDALGNAILTGGAPDLIEAVEVVAPGFGTQLAVFRSFPPGPRTVTLRAVGRLVGQVVADEPMAIAGVTMNVLTIPLPISEGDTLGSPFHVMSDAEGRFEMAEVPPGRLVVSTHPSGTSPYIALRPDGTEFFGKTTEVVAGRTTTVEVRVERGIKVHGSVREKGTGRPIAGVSVALSSNPKAGDPVVRTDSEGQYWAFLLPGTIRVQIVDAAPFRLPAGAAPPTVNLPKDSGELEIPPVELLRSKEVAGVVNSEKGEPVRRALVVASWFDQSAPRPTVRRAFARTDSRGNYLLTDLPPDIDSWLTARFEDTCSQSPVLTRAGVSDPITFTISRDFTRTIRGRVVDEYDKPIAGAKVFVAIRGKAPDNYDMAADLGLHGAAEENMDVLTGADGRFETPREIRHDVDVQGWASAPGKERGRSEWFLSTAPCLFNIVLFPTPPPEQAAIRKTADAGERAYMAGNYAEAARIYRAAVDEADRLHIKDPVSVATWLASLADVLNESGKSFDAEPVIRRSLALREESLGPNHPAVASSLSQLAMTCDNEGRFDEAEKLHRKAIDIRAKALGTSHPDYSRDLYGLAYHYTTRGEYQRAEPFYRLSLGFLEKVYGPDRPEIAYIALNKARNDTALGNYAEDEPLYQRALRIGEKTMGPDHSFVARVLEIYAHRLRKTDRDKEAAALEARAKAIRAK